MNPHINHGLVILRSAMSCLKGIGNPIAFKIWEFIEPAHDIIVP